MTKISVHLHLYYVDQLDDLLSRLQSLNGYSYDLYVTLIKDDDFIRNKILAFKPDAKIWQVPNLGYDVGPFIDFLHKIDLDNYDYVIKIHTKRKDNNIFCFFNKNRFSMDVWREMLLDAVISRKAVVENIKKFETFKDIGIIGSSYVTTSDYKDYRHLENDIIMEMKKIGCPTSGDKTFVAGTIFMIRANLLKPFLNYKIQVFKQSDAIIHDNTLAHILERMFGWVSNSQGYKILGVSYKSFYWQIFKASLFRFLYQKKINSKGYLIIKICKIPIVHRKVYKI